MTDGNSLLSADAVFTASVLYHASSDGIGRMRLQKLSCLSYRSLPSDVQSSLGVSFDQAWYGSRDLFVDRILEWLVQSDFVVAESDNVFGDEYTDVYSLSESGVHAYTQATNRCHPRVNDVMTRFEPGVVCEINTATQTIVEKHNDKQTGELINIVIEGTETPDDNGLENLF